MVIGAGGLGSHLLFHLASLGLKNIIVVDSDTVAISNLQRQIIFNEQSIDKNKAFEAKKTIESYNSDVNVIAINRNFTSISEIKKGIDFDIDIIFDCCDNYKTRIDLSKEASNINIPVIFAAVTEFEGWVYPQINKSSTLLQDIFPKHDNDENCDSKGVVSLSVAFVSSIQSMEGLKHILKLEDNNNKLFNINCFKYSVNEIDVGALNAQ